jgi:3-dehydroquinate dehydratase-2
MVKSMNKILLMHGPNLNLLGKRNAEHYGNLTLNHIEMLTAEEAKKLNLDILSYQSNHEGNLIDKLQIESKHCVGIIINPGAFTHYSYALYDALLDTQIPIVEVHLSDIKQREAWRSISVTAPACIHVIWGKKEKGYIEAVHLLAEHLKND